MPDSIGHKIPQQTSIHPIFTCWVRLSHRPTHALSTCARFTEWHTWIMYILKVVVSSDGASGAMRLRSWDNVLTMLLWLRLYATSVSCSALDRAA